MHLQHARQRREEAVEGEGVEPVLRVRGAARVVLYDLQQVVVVRALVTSIQGQLLNLQR